MSIEERKSQLEFEVSDNTKPGVDSIKNSLGGISQAAATAADHAARALDKVADKGEETNERLSRSGQALANSIKRDIASAQREIAQLKTSAAGGDRSDFFGNIISQRAPESAKALQPLIDKLRDARGEIDLLTASQRNATAANLFESQHQAAKKLVQDSEYVRMWTAALEQKEAAERKVATNDAFVKSLKAQSDAIGKTKADLLELQAAQLGVSDQAAPYIAKLRQQEQAFTQSGKVLNAYGQTAKQTAANLRQVPAQITDIVVSLQGGQAPLTVLLQQGGQLRDIFGGIAPAARALGGAVLGMVNPLTLSAAAVIALTYAYSQGSKEADAYNKSLTLTGNAAGATVSDLKAAAVAASDVIGTQGQAAAVVAQLAGTGQVAAASMREFAEVTLKAERDLGIATKDMVKNFSELGEKPAEAALKLNKQYNFLTVAVYEQIRALEGQGRAQEAATLAQNTYAEAMGTKADRLRTQLGSIERAWQGITAAAKSGWDAILNVGRAETTGDALRRLQAELDRRESEPLAVDNPAMQESRRKGIEYLKQQIGLLQSDERQQRRAAEAEAERTRAAEAGLRVSQLIYEGRTKQQKMDEELNRLQQDRIAGYIDEATYEKAAATVREKYKKSTKDSGARAAQARQSELADIRAKIKAEEEYTQRLREQGVQAEKNTAGAREADKIERELAGTLDAKTRAHKELMLVEARRLDQATATRREVEEQAKAIAKSEEALRKQIQTVYDEASATEQNRIKIDETTEAYGRSAAAVAQLAIERTKLRLAEAEGSDSFDPTYVANLWRLLAEQQKNLSSVQNAEFAKTSRALDEQIAQGTEINNLQQEEISLLGLTEVQRKQVIARREQEIKLAKELRAIDQSGMTDEQKEQAKAKAREKNRIDAINAGNKVILDDWQKTTDQINSSLTDALLRGFESGKDSAKNLRDTVINMFKTMALRPVISAVLSPISGAIGLALNGGGAGTAGGGGGGFGGLLNLASMGRNAYGLYQGGLSGLTAPGSMYYNFATSGIGQSLGLSNAAPILGNNPSAYMPAGTQLTNPFAGGLTNGSLAGAGTFAAVAALVLNAVGAFRSDRRVASGLRGTLGSGDITPWEEWREGGTLFSGPNYSTFNPVEALTRERARLSELRDMGADPGRIMTQQMIVDNLEDQYGDLEAGAKAQSDIIQKTFGAMRESVAQMGDVLGLNTDKVKAFTTALGGEKGLNLEGLKPEEAQAKIAEALATANNELAQQIIGTWVTTTTEVSRVVSENVGSAGEDAQLIYTELSETITSTRYVASEYAREGEKAIDTLTRLSTSLKATNDAFDALGYALFDASLAGGDLASQLVDLFGGIEGFAASTSAFLDGFYSAEEQRAARLRQIERELAGAGLDIKLPSIDDADARQQYRAIVESFDRTTEAGREAWAVLVRLAPAFAEVTAAVEDTTRSLKTQRDDALRQLERAIAAERRILQEQLKTAKDVASNLESIFDTLHSNVRELYGQVDSTRGMLASQGSAFIAQALATAKKSGYLPDADQLADAIRSARSGIDEGAYVSQFAMERDRLVLAGQLSGLELIAGKQLTDAQKTVRALEEQIDQGEQILDYWRQQIEIANGTYEGIVSVEQAILNLQKLLGLGGDGRASGGGRNGGTPSAGGGGAWARTSYGADEALESFEKFKDWYNGLRTTSNVGAMMDGGYDVPDWLRLSGMAADGTDEGMFGQYQFFQNNPQYAQDYEQIMTTGRSSYATDGSTLIRSDISKMPEDVADYYRKNPSALLMAEGFLLDPVLAFQLYRDGPERFGIDRSKISFTEWLRSTEWSEEGLKPGDGADRYSKMDYAAYKLTKRDPATGNLVGRDGIVYASNGTPIGPASPTLMQSLYGITGGATVGTRESYLAGLRQTFDQDIAAGASGQQLADKLKAIGAPLADVASAYGITVDVLKENLRIAGATSIPAYAVGTNYVPKDGLAYLHKGEAVVPKPYNPAANGGKKYGSDGRLEELVSELIAKVAALESAANATATNTRMIPQMADQFDNVTDGGNALRNRPVSA
jgi:phage-related minor tail protein